MALYTYLPLDTASREIRLLSLLPGVSADEIEIQLHHDVLDVSQPPEYEAVSYAWGSTENPASIKVRDFSSEEAQTMLITENLFSALQHLRSEDSVRVLWVDAICIDQKNVAERSDQVAIMGDIFRYASRVKAWLGPEEQDSAHAMQYINELSSQVSVDWVIYEIKLKETSGTRAELSNGRPSLIQDSRDLTAVHHLIMRSWFERLWIIQEITLGGTRGILLCGNDSISWQNFLDAILCIFILAEGALLGNHLRTRFFTRCAMIHRLAQIGLYGRILNLRTQLAQSKCSDPRDRIYGALNIIHNDGQKLDLRPDYSKSVAEVYQHTTTRWIEYYRRLDILSSCQLVKVPTDIPSWVPDWSVPLECKLLWQPGLGNFWELLVPYSFPADRTLQIFGVNCATIREVYDFSNLDPDMPSREYRDILRQILAYTSRIIEGDNYRNGETTLEAICRTLVVNKFSDRFIPHRHTLRRFLDCFPVFGGLNTDEIHPNTSFYQDLFFQTSPGRCFFTTREGYIGMAPATAKAGDKVCTILGCGKPMLLRPTVNGPVATYKLVGECFVHGLMAQEGIFGEFPAGYRQVFYHDKAKNHDMIRFTHESSDDILEEDPRPIKQNVEKLRQERLRDNNVVFPSKEDIIQIWRDSGVDIELFEII